MATSRVFLCSSVSCGRASGSGLLLATSGCAHAAPPSIQRLRTSIWSAVSGSPSAGITSGSSAGRLISSQRLLSCRSPATTGGYLASSPKRPALVSRRSLPFCLSGPWHSMQRDSRIGQTSFRKSTSSAGRTAGNRRAIESIRGTPLDRGIAHDPTACPPPMGKPPAPPGGVGGPDRDPVGYASAPWLQGRRRRVVRCGAHDLAPPQEA